MSGKAHRIISLVRSNSAAFGPEADISRQTRVAGAVENDPFRTPANSKRSMRVLRLGEVWWHESLMV